MINIDWNAFLEVFVAALLATVIVVIFYALGMRMLVRAGRLNSVLDSDLSEETTASVKPRDLSPAARRFAYVLALACFGVCAAAVLFGLGLIIFNH